MLCISQASDWLDTYAVRHACLKFALFPIVATSSIKATPIKITLSTYVLERRKNKQPLLHSSGTDSTDVRTQGKGLAPSPLRGPLTPNCSSTTTTNSRRSSSRASGCAVHISIRRISRRGSCTRGRGSRGSRSACIVSMTPGAGGEGEGLAQRTGRGVLLRVSKRAA